MTGLADAVGVASLGLEGRPAVVVGAGPGIGRACAELLAAAGATVVCADVDLERATETATLLRDQGLAAHEAQVDVTSEESVRSFFAEIERTHGAPAALVNIVGIGGSGTLLDLGLDEWDRMIGINLRQQFVVARECIMHMRTAGGGAVVTISSINALGSSPKNGVYGVAKAGVVSMTKTLAIENADAHVRVNSIAPGATATPRLMPMFESEVGDAFRAAIPLGRVNDPRDIARAVLFLLSDWASTITGQVLVVDGGLTAHYPLSVRNLPKSPASASS
jgi:NAD(P)-dependent dehydrogenase (short-subunit alcohol dehydrogenase family)